MGGGSQTTTQQASPWAGQAPYLMDVLNAGQYYFQRGQDDTYYPGTLVAPQSGMTQRTIGDMYNRGVSGSPVEGAAQDYVARTLGRPGANPYEMSGNINFAANQLAPGADLIQGAGAPGSYGDAASMAGVSDGAPGSAVFGDAQSPGVPSTLRDAAAGGYLGSNPYLDDVYDASASRMTEQFTDSVLPALNAAFSNSGRTGSGIQAELATDAAGELTDSLGQLGASIYAPAYESERDRMMSAAGLTGDLDLAASRDDIARRGMATDIYNRGLDRSLSAGGILSDVGMGGISAYGDMYSRGANEQMNAAGLAPTMQGMDYENMRQRLIAGGMSEEQAQREIDAEVHRYMTQQQMPWQNLNNYANLVYGMPGGYGTTTETQPRGSRLAGGIGGALTGFSLAGPWGAAAGGLGGLLS
jgi:hypothetical protein